MSVHIKSSKGLNSSNTDIKIHYLPCKIHADTDAKVNGYFETSVVGNREHLCASFRGYPLKGSEFKFPKGYKGMVLTESIRPLTEKEDRNFYVTHQFNSFHYWNWDTIPSKNDAFSKSFDWIHIAEALHKPIMLEESQDECKTE